MKKTVSVSYDTDKITALSMYLGQKNLVLEDELEKLLDTLYQKLVPQNVRDFLEMKEATSTPVKPKTAGKINLTQDADGVKPL